MTATRLTAFISVSITVILLLTGSAVSQFKETYEPPGYILQWGSGGSSDGEFNQPARLAVDNTGNIYGADSTNHRIQKFAPVLWFDVAGYDSYLSVATLHEMTAVRTLFQLENNGAPRFAFKNTSSDIEWSFQQSGPETS